MLLNWKEAKIEGRDSDKYKRWVKEAITIRKQRKTMNRDEGQFNLSHVYDDLLVAKACGNTKPKLTPSNTDSTTVNNSVSKQPEHNQSRSSVNNKC